MREVEELQSIKPLKDRGGRRRNEEEEEEVTNRKGFPELASNEPKVHISHPWPEWVDLMEHLLKKGYFGRIGNPFDRNEMGTKDSNLIRTACLNFGRDRFDLMRYFSRKDIRVVLESGCPSIDRKVVNSGKRLRAHVGIDEGNVCSSCSLRGSCERAYVKAREDEGGRTVDVMRILLTYGLDPITGAVENKLALNRRVKDSVRKLLTEMVEFSIKELDSDPPKKIPSKRPPSIEHSVQPQTGQIDVPMKQGDWICPKCNFINFAKNIKCLRCDGFFQERLKKLGEDQDHLPLKKGDWLCDKCNFLNFAKNTRCLQCKEKPPKRQLNPGEWECESCNYINFKRNMVCLKCDWKRPKASKYSDTSTQSQHEDKGLHQPYSMKFVRDEDEDADETSNRFSVGQERPSRKKVWSFLEDGGDEDEDGFSPSNKLSDFDDFPILGGKSSVSQDPQAREKWKEEMSKMRRIVSCERENHAQLPKKLEFLDSADDDEMAEWFGYGKKIKTEKFDALSKHVDKE
ncbi:zinc finger protein [Macleaya cordata]|uniref:Zinc finger protein n=1 Tax=Macleaya cordata TaxID=56857 RepID=A0A200PME8_MACCD|nr:zinc finger protein [Macleaya cordata]